MERFVEEGSTSGANPSTFTAGRDTPLSPAAKLAMLGALSGREAVDMVLGLVRSIPGNQALMTAGAKFVFCALTDPPSDGIQWPPCSEETLYRRLLETNPTPAFYLSTALVYPDDTGKPRNRLAQFSGLWGIVLDDVGTKVRGRPSIPPTFIVESSSGNEQWFYVFKTPITDLALAQCIVSAIYERSGLTDRGGKLVTKFARLPAGIHGKQLADGSRNPFEVRLLECNPENLYTPETLLAGLGVTLGPEQVSAGRRPEGGLIEVEDDPLVAILHQEGLVDVGGVQRDQAGGIRVDMHCPFAWSHTHRTDTSGAAYLTGRGQPPAFTCKHEGCAERTIKDLHEHIAGLRYDTDACARAESAARARATFAGIGIRLAGEVPAGAPGKPGKAPPVEDDAEDAEEPAPGLLGLDESDPVWLGLNRPETCVFITAGTGAHKSTNIAHAMVRDIAEGAFPFYIGGSKAEIDVFEDRLRDVSGHDYIDLNIGVVKGGDAWGDGDDGSPAKGRKSPATYAGIATHFWMTHRRGDSQELYGIIRELVLLKSTPPGDPDNPGKGKTAALIRAENELRAKPIRIYIDEAADYFHSLLRQVPLDHRTFSLRQRGQPEPFTYPVERCPANSNKDACRDCRMHENSLQGKTHRKYQHLDLETPKTHHERPPRGVGVVPVAEVLSRFPPFDEVAADAHRGFQWSVMRPAQGLTHKEDARRRLQIAKQNPEILLYRLRSGEAWSLRDAFQQRIQFAYQPLLTSCSAVLGGTPITQLDVIRLWDQDERDRAALAAAQEAAEAAAKAAGKSDEEATKAGKAAAKAFKDTQIPEAYGPDDLRFPSMACAVRTLHLVDMLPLLALSRIGSRIRFLGPSVLPWMRDIVEVVWDQPPAAVDIAAEAGKVDEVLIVDLGFTLPVSRILEIAEDVRRESGRRSLVFSARKEDAESAKDHVKGRFTFYEESRETTEYSVAHLATDDTLGLWSYIWSAIGRAVDLGDLPLMIISQMTHSPILSNFIDFAARLGMHPMDIIQAARGARLINAMGRILRRAPGETGTTRRVFLANDPDVVLGPTGPEALPLPRRVVEAVGGRAGLTIYLRVSSSANLAWVRNAINTFFLTGEPPGPEPQRSAEQITPGQRPAAKTGEEKREICLARLRECREQPPRMNWTLAREQKGIRTAFKKYFTAAEQARIKAAYVADEPL